MSGEAIIEGVSGSDVHETVRRLEGAARDHGLTVFAVIDHAAAARDAGLELADEVVVILGAPRVGTALMQEAPRVGLDLPLRVLVWDDAGTTRLIYRDPESLSAWEGLGPLGQTLRRMGEGLRQVIDATTVVS